MKKYNNINGFFLLDKPYGISSNKAVQIVKKILNIKKIGHSGSLDPLATGILPLLLGKSTKFSRYLMKLHKSYRVIAKLGEKTDTADSFGKIISIRKVNFSIKHCIKLIKNFETLNFQFPPMYSAVKYLGIPLYKYALKGICIKRKKRKIKIFKIDILKIKKKYLVLNIKCSSGTYIRTIIDDLGDQLKCGAHVIFLRRIKIKNFSCSNLITIKQLLFLKKKLNLNFFKKKNLKNIIFPERNIYNFLPHLKISKNFLKFLKLKKFISLNKKRTNKIGFFRIFLKKNNRYIGIGKISSKNKLFLLS